MRFCRYVGLVVSLGCTLLAAPLCAATKNIVLIVADDHGADLGCYGNPVIKTPNLDALAADGVLMERAFCTTASCSASRSVILTGLHNHANGHYGHQHDYHKFSAWANAPSLPAYLRAGGYRTARCGKFHVGPKEAFHFSRVLPERDAEVKTTQRMDRNPIVQADACRDFIQEQSDQPFLLYFCTNDPHRSEDVDQSSPLKLKPNRFGNCNDLPGGKIVSYTPEEVLVPSFLPDSPECRAELAQYYQSVSRIDQGVGQLVKHLQEAGVYDETLLLYISDHGIAMPGAKTTLYEPGMRSPCIVRNPYAAKRGLRSTAMISWVDLVPTLLEFAGVADRAGKVKPVVLQKVAAEVQQQPGELRDPQLKPAQFHGRSFLGILEQPEAAEWNEVYASHTFHEITMYYPMRVVRESRYKLIWNIAAPLPYPFASDLWIASTWQAQYRQGPAALYGKRTVDAYIHRPTFELYDLQSDPDESRNLADDPAQAENLKRMKQKLRDFQLRTRDPWVLKWEYE